MNASGERAAAIAFGLTVILVPVVGGLCNRWRLQDFPGPLSIHGHPVPRLGGVAVVIAICAAALVTVHSYEIIAWPFFAALGLTWVVGLADDVSSLSPIFRAIAQIAGATLLWHAGWRVPYLGDGAASLVGICLFVVAFANAFNFLDGSDGIAAGVAGIVAFGYVALPGGACSSLGRATSWSLLGACAGFLVFNFPPAKIFLGDSGSTTLGFVIAFLGLDFYRPNGAASASSARVLFPILIAALPLLDAALAVIRRLRSRASPFDGDRRHFYDLLLARGWSARRVAFSCYGITVAFTLISWLAARSEPAMSCALSASSLGALLLAAIRLGALQTGPEAPRSQPMQELQRERRA